MAEPYNLSQTIIGFIFVLYLVGSVSSAVMGTLSDHYGHGIIIVISVIIQLVGILLTLFMPLIVNMLNRVALPFGLNSLSQKVAIDQMRNNNPERTAHEGVSAAYRNVEKPERNNSFNS